MVPFTGSFDPYHLWLGIPPEEQPPNHYRLLGIPLFEGNADVIQVAADRQMMHLRTFQTGPHAADSQRLLNEVAAAKICLLNPARRAAYDQGLRQGIQENEEKQVPRPSPAIVPTVAETPPVECRATAELANAIEAEWDRPASRGSVRRNSSGGFGLAVVGLILVAVALTVGVIVVFLLREPSSTQTAARPKAPPAKPSALKQGGKHDKKTEDHDRSKDDSADKKAKPSERGSDGPDLSGSNKSTPGSKPKIWQWKPLVVPGEPGPDEMPSVGTESPNDKMEPGGQFPDPAPPLDPMPPEPVAKQPAIPSPAESLLTEPGDFKSPRVVMNWFRLTPGMWRVEGDCLAIQFGELDLKKGKGVLAGNLGRVGSFQFGFKMKSRSCQGILASIGTRSYAYARGDSENTESRIWDSAMLEPEVRSEETIASPDQWASLDVVLADGKLQFHYDRHPVWQRELRLERGQRQAVRVGFFSRETRVEVKDFYAKTM